MVQGLLVNVAQFHFNSLLDRFLVIFEQGVNVLSRSVDDRWLGKLLSVAGKEGVRNFGLVELAHVHIGFSELALLFEICAFYFSEILLPL